MIFKRKQSTTTPRHNKTNCQYLLCDIKSHMPSSAKHRKMLKILKKELA